jgi:adenylate cyclase
VKILDFGLAKQAPSLLASDASGDTLTRETTPGTLIGTLDYMSPEQVRSGAADARSDLFALGGLVHEMLAGEHAFARPTVADTLAAILKEEPRPLPPAVPSAVGRLVKHCLEKDKERRPLSARYVAAELRNLALSEPEARPDAIDSLAVLPFADLSPQKDQEYFCDGLADELIDALTRIRGLRVASRTSSFQWKGTATDVREVGRRLGVRAVLEGSVRKAGDRLRITVQVTDVARGFSLSSERYDRALADVFAIQEDIAQSVVAALKVTLSEGERRAMEKPPTADLRAYDLYLRARGLFNQTGDSAAGAYDLFRRAIELDPAFAQAHAALAANCAWLYQWRGRHPEHLEEALRESERALELRPDLAEAHAVRGTVLALSGQTAEAEKFFEAALELNPRLYEALYTYARTCVEQGRLAEAARLFERAAAVRPEDYQSRSLLALALSGLDQEDRARFWHREAIEVATRQLERNPNDVRAVYLTGGSFVRLGEIERGLEWLERARAMNPDDGGTLYSGFAQAGRHDRALDVLEQALDRAITNLDWIANDPDWEPLRDHPRFRALLDRLR